MNHMLWACLRVQAAAVEPKQNRVCVYSLSSSGVCPTREPSSRQTWAEVIQPGSHFVISYSKTGGKAGQLAKPHQLTERGGEALLEMLAATLRKHSHMALAQ